ncbi:MAG TPA: DUF5719 family protein [Acidimicrobiia bacterium]
MSEGRRVPVVVVIVLGALVVLLLGDPVRTRFATARADGRAPAATLVPEGVRSAVWYCAFATSDPQPRSDDAAILTNLGEASVAVAVSAMANGNVTSSRRVQLAGHATITLQAGDIGAAAGAGVLIEPFGSDVVVDHRATDAAGSVSQTPCATQASTDWYFPAGTTRRGSIERIALFNPFTQPAVVDVTAVTTAGATRPDSLQGLSVPPRSRTVINVNAAADQRNLLAVAINAERGTRVVAEVALEQRDTNGDGGFSIALGSPALGRDWHVAADGGANATPTLAILNPGASDTNVQVQTMVNGSVRAIERFLTAKAGTVTLVDVPVPANRPQMSVEVKSLKGTPSIAVAGLVTYQAKRGRAGPVSIVTGATLDARRSAFATPGPGGSRNVTVVLENESGTSAHVQIAIGNEGTVTTSVPHDSVTALTLGTGAQSAPLVVSSNTPVYAFRRLDEGSGVSTVPALPGT